MKTIDAIKMTGVYDLYMEITKEIDPGDLEKYIYIHKMEKGINMVYYSDEHVEDGSIYGIISGHVKLTYYPGKNHEYSVIASQGQWVGISGAISGIHTYADVEFLTDTMLLKFPLGKIMRERSDIMKFLWGSVANIVTKKYIGLLQHTMKLASMSNEFLFLKYLSESEYSFNGISTRELSEMMDINLRTLQRIIQNLDKEGVILRDKRKNNIWVEDIPKFHQYMNEIEK